VGELVETFESCEQPHQFAAAIEGYSPDAIEKAIALSDDQPRRKPAIQDSRLAEKNLLRGNKPAYVGQVAQILKVCKYYYETSLGSIPRIEVEKGYWSFV
jgi:hypothetical protein